MGQEKIFEGIGSGPEPIRVEVESAEMSKMALDGLLQFLHERGAQLAEGKVWGELFVNGVRVWYRSASDTPKMKNLIVNLKDFLEARAQKRLPDYVIALKVGEDPESAYVKVVGVASLEDFCKVTELDDWEAQTAKGKFGKSAEFQAAGKQMSLQYDSLLVKHARLSDGWAAWLAKTRKA